MTPTQRTEYDRLSAEQRKCWKRIADLESEKMALLSEHRGWKGVFER
jgi:cell division protein FtsB